MNSLNEKQARRLMWIFSGLFALGTLAISWFRWANFQYRTFDLAFYTQALRNLLQWKFHVSLLNVPLLGEHASVIVLPMAPLFAICPYPMLLVALQSLALATMAPVGYRICRHLGFEPGASAIMGLAALLAPATGFVALHEFHPEAFSAPFLMLLFEARLRNSLGAYWLWFLAVLSCKENMALLLIAYCAVGAVGNCKLGTRWLLHWCILPALAAAGWLALYGGVISPRLNAGNVDFIALYSHLGNSPADIIAKFFTEPGRGAKALSQSLTHGNLLWSLLFPFLMLPLLRPQWLLISAPVLLQHLLSWRASEWSVFFHYGAPLLPLFWVATAESIAGLSSVEWVPPFARSLAPALVLGACLAVQGILGPARTVAQDLGKSDEWREARTTREALLANIPPNASVVAPLPYLSHLAFRDGLFSLHHILKGLRTLSRSAFLPPATTDFVLVDYGDTATFDTSAAYYHPTMRAVDGNIYPSSDRLLHEFLAKASWEVESRNELTLFKKIGPAAAISDPGLPPQVLAHLDAHNHLISVEKSSTSCSRTKPLQLALRWKFSGERNVFPWVILRLTKGAELFTVAKRLCAPEGYDSGRVYLEKWNLAPPSSIPRGEYKLEALFFDNSKAADHGAEAAGADQAIPIMGTVDLGLLRID